MKVVHKNIFHLCLLLSLITLVASSCKKNGYYEDSGTHSVYYDGNIMEYLEAKPEYFDSLVQIIKIAGMEDIFKNNEITFFAPADSSIRFTMELLNKSLYSQGLDTVSDFSQINPEVWRDELSLYIFEGKHLLDDYPQLDLDQIPVFPGQAYQSYDGRTMNIGVIYNDAGGVQFAGYRQLVLSFIPSLASPQSGWENAWVSSSNIQPDNGVVHTLKFTNHHFGFSTSDFIQAVTDAGVGRN